MKTGGIFFVADFLETHNTECDISAYNGRFFLLVSLADYFLLAKAATAFSAS